MQRKLFRYYGAKTDLIDDIFKVVSPLYISKKITAFVDVFGGSGLVLLNIPLEWKINKVYNDIDDTINTLLYDLIDDQKRKKLFDKLFWILSSRKLFNEFKTKNDNDSFEFLYRIFNSFNGDMDSYSTPISTIRNVQKSQFERLKNNWQYIKEWRIECLDFQRLIKNYDSKTTFFYLDPPYLKGGKKYKYSFGIEDFYNLKNSLNDIQGYWLMNESERDFSEIESIFGKPNFTLKYKNNLNKSRKQIQNINRNSHRLEGYWYNF